MQKHLLALMVFIPFFCSTAEAWVLEVPFVGSYDSDDGTVRVKPAVGGEIIIGKGGVVTVMPKLVPKEIEPLLQEAKKAGNALQESALRNGAALVQNLGRETQKSLLDVLNTHDKALLDTANNLLKSANDAVDAATALARYAEREVQGYKDTLSNADKRLRQGKILDAIWGMGIERLQNTEQNIGQLAQDNAYVAQAMQAAASVYGGPAGSAAFAAWMAYRNTGGNFEIALKAGVLAYAQRAGYADVNTMPSGNLGELLRKSAVAGAVGGLGVAASGGTTEESINSFIKNGGAIVVQSGQTYLNQKYIDPAKARTNSLVDKFKAKADTFCVTAVDRDCAAVAEWAETAKKNAETAKRLATAYPVVATSPDGNWAISASANGISSKVLGVPSVVLTYVGDGSPVRATLNTLATLPSRVFVPATWVAYRDVGVSGTFFRNADPDKVTVSPAVGDILIATRNVNVRSGPADWGGIKGLVGVGAKIIVDEVRVLAAAGFSQEWIRFQNQSLPDSLPTGAEPSLPLNELITAIAMTQDQATKKELKLKARGLVAPDFNFNKISFKELNDYFRYNETITFVSYDPKNNVLTIRREREEDSRSNLEMSWVQVATLDAKIRIHISRLNKMRISDDGFAVDCNGGGGQRCISYEVTSERCNPSAGSCESSNDWYLNVTSSSEAAKRLKKAFTAVIYKIDGRPPK